MKHFPRRELKAALAAMAALLALSLLGTRAASAAEERSLSLYNIHTKETLTTVFKRDGRFVPDALENINHIMRDWRQNESIKMDPALIDLIWEIHRELGSQKPVYIISGYRSPRTNTALRRAGGGQAKHSRHMTGQAVDVHFPDVPVKQLRNSALIRERGGVGYYPTSVIPFVHLDTGNVRHWPRLPRSELAILFPNGSNRHVPTDGRPLTRKDFQLALARVQSSGGELPVAIQRRLNIPPKPPGPVLASLGPTPGPAAAAPPPENKAASPAAPPPYKQTAAAVTPVFVVPPPYRPADAAKPFGPGFVPAALPRPGAELGENDVARAPEYDDDHPDEFNYQPFPILPMLAETPIAYMDMSKEARPIVHKPYMVLSDGAAVAQLELGPQFEGMYWAQRFTGKAVNGAMTKFQPNAAAASTFVKSAQNAPPGR